MNPKLRKRLANSARGHGVQCRFDLDKRLYGLRLILSALLALSLAGAGTFLALPLAVFVPMALGVPCCIGLAWHAYRMCQARQPAVAIAIN